MFASLAFARAEFMRGGFRHEREALNDSRLQAGWLYHAWAGNAHERKDRLIISQVFDSPKIPHWVLDYLMFHELLHKFLGIGRRDDGRRCMHGSEFREIEKQYAYFEEAQAFLKKKL